MKGGFDWIGTQVDSSALHTGWTVGGGVEYAINKSWSLKGEANFANLTAGGYRFERPREGTYPEVIESGLRATVERATLGLNYQF